MNDKLLPMCPVQSVTYVPGRTAPPRFGEGWGGVLSDERTLSGVCYLSNFLLHVVPHVSVLQVGRIFHLLRDVQDASPVRGMPHDVTVDNPVYVLAPLEHPVAE